VNEAIELHDSELATVTFAGASAVVSFRPAYLHRSAGRPACDAGSGWLQPATLVISAASVSARIQLPATVSAGSLRLGAELHENIIPAGGTFAGPIELSLLLTTSESLIIRGDHVTISLEGDPTYLEDVNQSPGPA